MKDHIAGPGQTGAVAMGNAVVAFMRSMENLDGAVRHGNRCVRFRQKASQAAMPLTTTCSR
jgi:hypothetical protein